ncbi:MAG TPA: chemotaxis-specific protein-glutamate methyltransferase CheB [Mycobacteriales bacterium]|nr:chemotaxis-specific protein-glutamate methyltransferase CheB [Mycobacteriales bacterium]
MSVLPAKRPPLAVVVVDDSPVQRRFLRAVIEAGDDLSVVGEARNGREAIALVERLRPGAVLMDLDLPLMNGIEAIERIMATRPTPILVYSSFVDGTDNANARAALAAGAVDVVGKPGPEHAGRMEDHAEELRSRLRVASRIRVITHPRGRLRGHAGGTALSPKRPAPEPRSDVTPEPAPNVRPSGVRLLAIGASTGGPQALATVLGSLPAGLDIAVLVVQHMADGFIEGLAGWLDELIALPVAVGQSGRRLAPGTVTVAPSGLNLIVHDHLRVTTEVPPPTQFHIPGIDATFRSVAAQLGSEAIGVLLTGMGRDGALGLQEMHDRGAMTIAQDESTSAVYGMPGAAAALGAADRVLPLPEIGSTLLDLLAVPAEAQP